MAGWTGTSIRGTKRATSSTNGYPGKASEALSRTVID
jgi:hypothetical protein